MQWSTYKVEHQHRAFLHNGVPEDGENVARDKNNLQERPDVVRWGQVQLQHNPGDGVADLDASVQQKVHRHHGVGKHTVVAVERQKLVVQPPHIHRHRFCVE